MKWYYGKLLRVNLAEKSYTVDEIPEELFTNYLGGRGLGSYLLLEHVQADIDPLSEENKVIFTNGFTTGTSMFGSSRYAVFSKSPQTGLFGEATSGGKVAPALHSTGYDAIILEGASAAPVYLEINDREVIFHSAEHLWGKETYETEDTVLREVNTPKAQAVVIGPAGENLVSFACIENNYWHSAGRSGIGAVLGSKKVKALVFYGESKTSVVNPELLQELMKEMAATGKDHAGVKAYRRLGTTQMVAAMNAAKAFPNRYWRDAYYSHWEKISGETLLENFEVKPTACPKCFISCSKKTTVKTGRHKGLTIEGPEYETIFVFGGLCLIPELDEIIYLNDLCDRLGMDTITAGNLIGLVMEAGQLGRIPVKLEYGDVEGAAQLLRDIADRRGVGQVLARGIKEAAKEWGLEDLAIHVKGMEPAGYDPRPLKGMGLAYATSSRGACHLRASFYKPELSGMIDRKTTQGKAEMLIDWENRLTIFNTGTLCQFFRDLLEWPNVERLVYAITGLEYHKDKLSEIANQIVTNTRIFNAREGATKQEDTLPPRFFKEPVNNGQDRITVEELQFMVDEYYKLRGWDDSGYPVHEEG
ncbi:aldehyde ferredoxin oxidoreductase family protein [Desulfosporosinus sp. BICA1-9]|uniref:aldehyde ferredoxin oxidoreductase family protein n=1 Tax=Desulfosporosinus sp. BICA1-9 TaxID=1531958 RepID=UPI00054B2B4F|nr:aldehyde ferredoxin oxidoreductase family protein [Desulfosporosinus sp. BICA1-9]KJS48856.1 MAG: aldehyde:ferredoxin oxidoreductase [Peptococcaceae bacterium BRH_c23]KJS83050.1 MAG: aldehyde:ferredoxin oxidoreductase [Desulfosporosinus sp. BICA1-9]HBV88425.1 aldehyde:ferredoxin oxidoreductase [Desulfosporosinus sp.]